MTPRRDLTPAEIREMLNCMEAVRRLIWGGKVAPVDYRAYERANATGRWTWA